MKCLETNFLECTKRYLQNELKINFEAVSCPQRCSVFASLESYFLKMFLIAVRTLGNTIVSIKLVPTEDTSYKLYSRKDRLLAIYKTEGEQQNNK